MGTVRHGGTGLLYRPGTYDENVIAERGEYLLLRPGEEDVLLDLGANIGAVTHAFALSGVQHVVAVEPEPGNFHLLAENCASLDCKITTLNKAVGRFDGTRDLWLSASDNLGMHSTVVRRSDASIQVQCARLSALIEAYRPTLIKMDIEGAEYELLGELERLPRYVRGLAIELHLDQRTWRDQHAPRLVEGLLEQGFRSRQPVTFTGVEPGLIAVFSR